MARVNRKLGQLRIIAGEWRGRCIQFPIESGLRPTHDRIRETLFNWLQADIAGANCLDLFAGSGALGFEALSRGAKHTTFVESDITVSQALKVSQQKLQTDNVSIFNQPFSSDMPALSTGPFDLVFLDPPYEENLIEQSVLWLCNNDMLSEHALVFIECEKEYDLSVVDKYLEQVKLKHTRHICYGLYTNKTW
ncbi:MAG: 16S rRNA (guanine(966)-N(2))-methyltransferase RsmD [Coxiellaceae bacterium]|nr:16S rRNA (guanine(966)-N(2))-methyltransferase RsmD [Coxiellaceae bacterium]